MTLGFSLEINGNKTHFMEKILSGKEFMKMELDLEFARTFFHPEFDGKLWGNIEPKIHTIRKDKTAKWKEGNKIHMVIHNRTSKRFQFAPTVTCLCVQKISIKHYSLMGSRADIFIDGKCYVSGYFTDKHDHDMNSSEQRFLRMQKLAFNDGFISVQEFFEYFNSDFEGVIIHWTNLMY